MSTYHREPECWYQDGRGRAPAEHPVLIPAAYWAILHIVNANEA